MGVELTSFLVMVQAQGNAAFSAGKFEEAIDLFTKGIEIDGSNHVLYSNRSASYASLGKYEEALEDGKQVVELKPDWGKGYSRVGAALFGLKRWKDAEEAYSKGLEIDPENAQLKSGLEETKKAAEHKAGGGGMFTQPQVIGRLATDPRTRSLMGQPDFMAMLKAVDENPQNMQQYLQDERFQLAMQVGLGLNFAMPGKEGPGGPKDPKEGDKDDFTKNEGSTGAGVKEDKEKEDAAPMEEDSPDAQAKKQAYEEKDKGNSAYKDKRFEEAIEHYNKALELFDQDISFITNRAAVKYETGDLEGCIEDCEKAIERGRELRTDYKLIARAMTRKGNALMKMGKLEEAISTYNRSLTEHRNADTLKRLNEAEKALKDKTESEYINMDLCGEEKDKGNAAFKEQKYPEAVKHYTEAIKRGPPSVNPEAHKLFSNRAACYTKLGAWNEGLKDAEECIKLAPEFAKGYSRKGHLQYFMKEYSKAMSTYEEGLKHDPENAELKDGLSRCVQAINRVRRSVVFLRDWVVTCQGNLSLLYLLQMNRGEMSEEELKQRQERGMADPEIQGILSDPIMRQVLREMEENPASAQKHLAHPEIAKKFEKLVAAGIVQVR